MLTGSRPAVRLRADRQDVYAYYPALSAWAHQVPDPIAGHLLSNCTIVAGDLHATGAEHPRIVAVLNGMEVELDLDQFREPRSA